MSEIRESDFSRRKVLFTDHKISTIKKVTKSKYSKKNCELCPGNESKTNIADLVIKNRKGILSKLNDEIDNYVSDWSVRAFINKDPLVKPEKSKKDSEMEYGETPLYYEPSFGYHYTIVITPDHIVDLADMKNEQWVNVFTTIQDKARWIYAQKNVSYVVISLNKGELSGTSKEHPHIEMISLPILPKIIEEEASIVQRSIRREGVCKMCETIKKERNGERFIAATNNFVAFSPYASITEYECCIFPIKHQTSFLKISQKDIGELSYIFTKVLSAFSKLLDNPSINLVIHTSPEKKASKQIHWHFEIYPRITNENNLDRSTGLYINRVLPEKAAEKMRNLID